MIHANRLKGLGLIVLLSGCVADKVVEPPVRAQPARPPAFSAAGLQNVIGRNARFLEAQFGKPQLDVREGTARKLQFIGPVCVLDAYLYPPARGGDAIVTYVDARLPDGRDFDRASCVAALTRREEAR